MTHVIQLINYTLRPTLQPINLSCHMPKLMPHNRLLDQFLPKCFSLLTPIHRILQTRSRSSQSLKRDPQPLVVEVTHGVLEALSFLTHEIADWNFDVFKRHICGGAQPTGADLNLARADARKTWDQEHRHAFCARTASADCCLYHVSIMCMFEGEY